MDLKFHNKNILVTGGTGFIGSHLVKRLVDLKSNVITTFQTINPQSYFYQNNLDKKVISIPADVCDFNTIFNITTRYNIDFIFHLAAQPLVDVAFNNPSKTLYTNILGTINVLESARMFPHVKAVIIASSDKAYGKLDSEKYLEKDALKGDHPYEVSKSSADLIAYSYFKTYNTPVSITRFGNIYGEGDLNFSRIIPGIVRSIIRNERLQIRSNGKFVRDYLYVKDVVDGYLILAENINKCKGQAFNFGSKESLSVIELINLIEKYIDIKIKYDILDIAKNEIPYQSLDFTKINNLLGWKPKFNIKKSIKQILKYYKKIL